MGKNKWIIGETEDKQKLVCNKDEQGNLQFTFNDGWKLPKVKIDKEEFTSLFHDLFSPGESLPDASEEEEDPNVWDSSLDWHEWNERKR